MHLAQYSNHNLQILFHFGCSTYLQSHCAYGTPYLICCIFGFHQLNRGTTLEFRQMCYKSHRMSRQGNNPCLCQYQKGKELSRFRSGLDSLALL
ncbi:hypothetical protein HanIR_Chr03g0141061 [Helianthus annuus]|nr:hypothetical protein HanIR_Chr03g0141061 [Helianthus annuus]